MLLGFKEIWLLIDFVEKIREVSVGFQECLFDEREVFLGCFVLNHCNLTVNRIAIFANRLVVTLNAGQDSTTVCYPHSNNYIITSNT